MINVNRTYLPNKDKLLEYIDFIYEKNWVTNNGKLVQLLEKRLEEYLGVKNIILVSNGTAALQIAYKLFDIEKDVVTTPFSFVATTSSMVFNKINPVFADIDLKTLNIDPNNIKRAITKDTQAIVPVHVFGNSCNIEDIEDIARKNSLKVIYDAAHCFGVKYKGKSILSYGDISVISFHATKLFHTIEGGAIVVKDDELAKKARFLINFGIENEESIPALGINAKMNEFEAAMGLALLDEIDDMIKERKEIYEIYIDKLDKKILFQNRSKFSTNNYSYFPIILENEERLLYLKDKLNSLNIFPRRYFYPSLDTLNYVDSKFVMKNSQDISRRILCLPIFVGLDRNIQNTIIKEVNSLYE